MLLFCKLTLRETSGCSFLDVLLLGQAKVCPSNTRHLCVQPCVTTIRPDSTAYTHTHTRVVMYRKLILEKNHVNFLKVNNLMILSLQGLSRLILCMSCYKWFFFFFFFSSNVGLFEAKNRINLNKGRLSSAARPR